MSKIRKWNDSYVSFGFTKVIRNGQDYAQCLHCSVVMANASLRPSKLKNHRDKKHPQKRNENIDTLSAKRVRYDQEGTLPRLGFSPEEKPALQCSYEVAYQIAKCRKPHTIAEELIKPCAEKMVEIMIGPGEKKKIQQLSMSNNTIRRRIDDMATDVCQQVCSEIKQSMLQASLQLDESTDTTLECHLIAFAQYEKNKKMKEEFLFCNTLSATTTAADIKVIVDSFFETNELSWQNFKHICTDGAPAMIGIRGGFVTLVKNEWPHVTSSHCSLHRYALALKTLPPQLMEVMDVSVKVINFIRSRGKNHRLFQVLAKEMGAKHMGLLLYTKVRWLSRGSCLHRLYELRNEVEAFLQESESTVHVQFHSEEFMMMLAYLADVFGHFNEANLSLQGREVTVSDVKDKLAGLCAQMGVWQARLKAGFTISFPLLHKHLEMNKVELPNNIKTCIIKHLEIVCAEFQSYFSDTPLSVSWHKDPFNTKVNPMAEEAEELAEFKVSNAMKQAFSKKSDLSSFWLSLHDSYPILSKKASVMFVQFATTYLCEAGFSDLVTIKTKSRNRLDACNDIRLAQSKTEPNIKGLIKRGQEQTSH